MSLSGLRGISGCGEWVCSQFCESSAWQGALDGRQQVVVHVELFHLLQSFQTLEGLHAVVVEVQDLEFKKSQDRSEQSAK